MPSEQATAEFKSNPTDFFRQTARRVFVEFLVLGFLISVIFLDLIRVIPLSLQWAVVALGAAYIVGGLVFYPRAKAIANSLSVKLNDRGLVFSHVRGGGELRYVDLKVTKAKKVGGKLVEVILTAKSGQVIKLRGLENMEEFYRALSQRITC